MTDYKYSKTNVYTNLFVNEQSLHRLLLIHSFSSIKGRVGNG